MNPNSRSVRFNLYTIIAVYFLILVGGIVRSMGAGMGCPDWPKCFGSYVPPSSPAELPENYEDLYVSSRLEKNDRLASLLETFGFKELSEKVSQDPRIASVTYFDVQKAWVEYVNRLIGVVIGLLIILNMLFSFKYWKNKRSVVYLAIASFVLVVFQGWIGSLVVSTNLLPGFISFHMMLALLLVALLLLQRFQMVEKVSRVTGRYLLVSILLLFTLQIIMGVQVRESIDVIKTTTDLPRTTWIAKLGSVFYVHRSYSLLLMALIGYATYINFKRGYSKSLFVLLGVAVILEVVFGIIMAYFGVPAFAQPIHLLLGTVAFGVIFYLFLSANSKTQFS